MIRRLWDRQRRKFAAAGSGLRVSVVREDSFYVHLPIATAVVVVARWVGLPPVQWAVLAIAIGLVIACELLNTAVEELARGLKAPIDPAIRRSLDAAAAAVLVVAAASVVVGLLILGPPLWTICQTWMRPLP